MTEENENIEETRTSRSRASPRRLGSPAAPEPAEEPEVEAEADAETSL